MGWKNLKEAFSIEHRVTVTGSLICIGSPLVHDLVKINMETGEIQENQTFGPFLKKHYPELLSSPAWYIRQLIQRPDTFEADIPVYTFRDGEIIECLCERPGYPNVTHDGQLMYENRFSTSKDQVIAWAKQDLLSWYNALDEQIERLQADMDKAMLEHAKAAEKVRALEARYPHVEVKRR